MQSEIIDVVFKHRRSRVDEKKLNNILIIFSDVMKYVCLFKLLIKKEKSFSVVRLRCIFGKGKLKTKLNVWCETPEHNICRNAAISSHIRCILIYPALCHDHQLMSEHHCVFALTSKWLSAQTNGCWWSFKAWCSILTEIFWVSA